MPRYYFDVDDGENPLIDNEGTDLPNLNAARREAIGLLPDLAEEGVPELGGRVFICKVRDHSGRTLLITSLSVMVEWVA